MKKIISILAGTLCAFTFFVNADGISIEDPAAIADVPADVAVNKAPADPSGNVAKKKGSWFEKILDLFKVSDPARTVEQAFNEMMTRPNVVIDFSNVSDFAQNGDAKMTEYYKKIKATKAFGSRSPNLYVNLSKTGVSVEFIAKWSKIFARDRKIVIWNLSDNPNIDDSIFSVLNIPSIRSLNLSGTSVTDAGIAKLAAIIEAKGIGKLICVYLTGTKVTDAGVESLRASMQRGVEAWKAKNPGKDFKLQGTNGSGVVFEKVPALPKKPGSGEQNVAQKQVEANPNAAEEISDSDPLLEQQTSPEADPLGPSTPDAEVPGEEKLENALPEGEAVPDASSLEGEANAVMNDADALIKETQSDVEATPDAEPTEPAPDSETAVEEAAEVPAV